jgi:hypothetical protein
VLARLLVAAVLAALSQAGLSSAQPAPAPQTSAATEAPKPNDYSNPNSWLCRPGRHDACDIDLTTTIVAANGKLTREAASVDVMRGLIAFTCTRRSRPIRRRRAT